MHKPTTHREFYCRVRYPAELPNPTPIFWSGKFVNTTCRLTNSPVYWLPNRNPLQIGIKYPYLSYYLITVWSRKKRPPPPPPPVQLNLVSGEYWTLRTPLLFLHFGGRRTNNIYPVNLTGKQPYLFRKRLSLSRNFTSVIGNLTLSVIRTR